MSHSFGMRYPTLTINDTFPNLEGSTQDSNDFDLYHYLGDSWGMMFMHPGDFTPVCTTELGQAALREKEFARRNMKLCGFSCNSQQDHMEWIKDIEHVTQGKITFPLLCDPDRTMARDLGLLDASNLNAEGMPLTARAVYILKPDNTIALTLTYPAGTGRSFDELLRVADSVIRTETKHVATPADWQPGQDVIVNFPLTNQQADETFGKNKYEIVHVPSEQGRGPLTKNYLRTTADPGPILPIGKKQTLAYQTKKGITNPSEDGTTTESSHSEDPLPSASSKHKKSSTKKPKKKGIFRWSRTASCNNSNNQ
eukprot:CAMPEP_0172465818 /NCGR_PEP_ID=MMETSP1065-20121228/54625_1 /TAXON_ID=265537 /ORGANISM="Amphiprora paludosa, Strain CCMP125" /LENGTH=310 /DNA_ID=CAMNT_0013222463 /DNA_START=106 /DNA_END=1038 /DNA_ORIENTATION=+